MAIVPAFVTPVVGEIGRPIRYQYSAPVRVSGFAGCADNGYKFDE